MNRKMISVTIALLVITSMIISACGAAATTAAPATAAPATAAPATAAPATAAPATAVQPTVAPEPVTLTIWHNWGPDDTKGAPLQSIFKDFMAANPNITIKDSVYVDADIPLKVETASTSKQEPDLVFSVLFDGVLNWGDNGVAVPVNDYIKQWGLDGKFTDVALATYTMPSGVISAFPLEGATWPIWYNMKLFNQAGLTIPTTTDQLIADAKVFRSKGIGGPVIASGADGMGGALFNLIVQSMMTDQETVQAFGKGDWTSPGAVAGVKLFVQLRDAGVFVDGVEGVDYASGDTRFFAGSVPMAHFGAWSYTDPADTVVSDVKLGGFPLATGSPWKRPVYYAGFTGKGIFITPNGKDKIDAVKKFIQFFYQPDIIARFVYAAGMTPPLKDITIDKSKLPPLVAQAFDLPSIGDTPTGTDTILPPAVGTDMGRITQEAFASGTTAEKILQDLTAAYAAIK